MAEPGLNGGFTTTCSVGVVFETRSTLSQETFTVCADKAQIPIVASTSVRAELISAMLPPVPRNSQLKTRSAGKRCTLCGDRLSFPLKVLTCQKCGAVHRLIC